MKLKNLPVQLGQMPTHQSLIVIVPGRCGSAESTSRLLTLSVATLPNQIIPSLIPSDFATPLSFPSRFLSDTLHLGDLSAIRTPTTPSRFDRFQPEP